MFYESEYPESAGIGLRSTHYAPIRENLPHVGFLEVHPENYLCGGPTRRTLLELSEHYHISFHGVGLSLGGDDLPNEKLLAEIKELADEVKPLLFSEHASWSASGNAHLNDLLPLPYNEESLDRICRNVDRAQTMLKKRILIENPSTYLEFEASTMGEAEFLSKLSLHTGCGLLLDLNNVVVNAYNHGYSAKDYIGKIPASAVGEYHLAGHTEREFGKATLKIDTHDREVSEAVWELYAYALPLIGYKPTLVEWDSELPPLSTLLKQAQKADAVAHKVFIADAPTTEKVKELDAVA